MIFLPHPPILLQHDTAPAPVWFAVLMIALIVLFIIGSTLTIWRAYRLTHPKQKSEK